MATARIEIDGQWYFARQSLGRNYVYLDIEPLPPAIGWVAADSSMDHADMRPRWHCSRSDEEWLTKDEAVVALIEIGAQD